MGSCSWQEAGRRRLIKAVVNFTPFTVLSSVSLFTALDTLWELRTARNGAARETQAERVNRQQLSQGKAFQKQRIHRHSLLLLLHSLNSWRKCLIKIFVLLCLSEMTYDSSLSQTPNSHSICHSHPTRDSLSPRKMERRGGEDVRQNAAGIRPQTLPVLRAQAPNRRMGATGGRGK